MTDQHWCGSCREPCEVQVMDGGIGHYEFWGQRGNDVRLYLGSTCCEAQAYEDPDCRIEAEIPEKT